MYGLLYLRRQVSEKGNQDPSHRYEKAENRGGKRIRAEKKNTNEKASDKMSEAFFASTVK